MLGRYALVEMVAGEQIIHALVDAVEIGLRCRGPCDKDIVAAFHLRDSRPNALAQQPLDAVARHCAAQLLAHGKTDAQFSLPDEQQHKLPVCLGLASAVDILKGGILLQRIDSLHEFMNLFPPAGGTDHRPAAL